MHLLKKNCHCVSYHELNENQPQTYFAHSVPWKIHKRQIKVESLVFFVFKFKFQPQRGN